MSSDDPHTVQADTHMIQADTHTIQADAHTIQADAHMIQADTTPDSAKTNEPTPDALGRSSNKFFSRENLMFDECHFDKETVIGCLVFICVLIAAAVIGVVVGTYTIANLQTYNIPVDNADVNLVNILLSRDKMLFYLPAFPDGQLSETQTIMDKSNDWVVYVNRQHYLCFLRKITPDTLPDVEVVRQIAVQKRPLQISSSIRNDSWSTRRPTDAERAEVGSFIWDSCGTKEMLVMSHINLPPLNNTACTSFCLPHYAVTTSQPQTLYLSQINCVPALCDNRF